MKRDCTFMKEDGCKILSVKNPNCESCMAYHKHEIAEKVEEED